MTNANKITAIGKKNVFIINMKDFFHYRGKNLIKTKLYFFKYI